MIDVDGRVIDKGGVERVFWPKIRKDQWDEAELDEIESPLDLRAQLFKIFNTSKSEDAVMGFLNRVGAWETGLGNQRNRGQKEPTWTYLLPTAKSMEFASYPPL